MYRSRNHDYVYYPSSWLDELTGRRYESGFYDELGNHYDHVVIKNGANYETRASCDYCGTEIKLNWTEGALPSCPNCGALLHEIVDNSIVEEQLQDIPQYSSGVSSGASFGRRMAKTGIIVGAIMTAMVGIVYVSSAVSTITGLRNYNSEQTTTEKTKQVEEVDDKIYVEEIGRTCYWEDEYDSYYDEVSDCYFWYKDSDECWEYWFEDVSSDYGDYGWMQYDYFDEAWYIEESDGNWILLPAEYDESALWHMDESGTGRYNGLDTLYVEAIDRNCEFDRDYAEYYDPETKCHFWYNDLVEPPVWQYWYEGISSDFGDYGWMEYDEDEDCWYIEQDDSDWVQLPDEYDTSALWHIEMN